MGIFSILLTTLLTYTAVLSQVIPGVNPALGLGGLGGTLNPALGGLPGALPGAGIGSLLDGTYTWIGIDGGTYTLNVCSGLGFDRSLYAGIERAALNNFGLPQNSLFFFNIIGRSNGPRLGVDGAVATFQGIRLGDTFGFRNIIFTLIFARCDNSFQLIINDEAYTLIKTSNIVLNQNSCWLPGQQTFLGLPNTVQFSTQLPMLNGFNRIVTLNRLNNNNIFGCFGNQNIQTNAFTPGLGTLFGNGGLGGRLLWNNRLLISPFQDQLNPLCRRGIELLLLRPNNRLFCNRRCMNMPAIGFSGVFNRLPTWVNGFQPQQCVAPNFNNVVGFPGFPQPSPIINPVVNPLVNPGLVNPGIVNPGLVNPGLVNPGVVNPGLVNPRIVNPGIVNPGLVNPGIVNPGLVNPGLVNPVVPVTPVTPINPVVGVNPGIGGVGGAGLLPGSVIGGGIVGGGAVATGTIAQAGETPIVVGSGGR